MEILGVLAVITNGFLIGFSSRIFFNITSDPVVLLAFVIIFEHILLFIKVIISFAIPDIPEWIRKSSAKREFLKDMTFTIKAREENDKEKEEGASEFFEMK